LKEKKKELESLGSEMAKLDGD